MIGIKLNYQKTYKFILYLYVFMQILFTTTYEGIGSLNKFDIRNITYLIVLFIQLILLLMFYKFENRKYELFTISIVGFFLMLCFFIDGSNLNFLILVLFILLGSKVQIADVCEELTTIVGLSIVFVFVGSFLGIFDNIIFQRANVLRYSFGFITPNAFGAVALEYWLLRMFTRKNVMTKKNIIIFLTLFYLTFYLAKSRTASILMITSIVFFLYLKYIDKLKLRPIIRWCTRIIVLIIPIFVIFFSIMYNQDNSNHWLLNELFSGRLYYSNLFLSEYDLTLFGTDLTILTRDEALKLGETYKFLDCAYIYIAIEYGLLLLGLLVAGFYSLLKRKMSSEHYSEVVCILIFMIYGIFELGFFSLEINFTLLMLSELFHKFSNDKKIRKNT